MTKRKEKHFDLTKAYEDFLANGGEVQVFEPGQRETKLTVGISKKAPELMTLEEGALLYTKKQVRPRKIKVQDFSGIDASLIPEHLRHILEKGIVEVEEELEDEEELEEN